MYSGRPRIVHSNLLLLDRLAGLVGYSAAQRLRSGYTGAAYKVRRDSDNDELDIGFLNNAVDTAALLQFCGAASGFVSVLYDQGLTGLDQAQSTAGSQPRVVNAGTLDLSDGGQSAMSFDGSDDWLGREDALGFSGSQATTVGYVCSISNGTTNCVPYVFGGIAAASNLQNMSFPAVTNPFIAQGGAFFRGFTGTTCADSSVWVAQRGAAEPMSAAVVRQNGAALPQSSITGPGGTCSYLDERFRLGAFIDNSLPAAMRFTTFVLFTSVLAGADLTALESALALHK